MYRKLLPLLLLCSTAGADVRYGPPLTDGEWQLESSRLICRLTRPLPGFGSAAFVRAAGADAAFELDLLVRRPVDGRVQLYALPPPWDHRREARELGQATAGGSRLRLDRALTEALMMALEQGLAPGVGYRDTQGEWVEVLVSPVNVRSPMDRFIACGSRLLPSGFEALRHTAVGFAAGSAEIAPAVALQLERVAEYLLADGSVRRVVVEGSADRKGVGERSQELAEQRAAAVRDWFVAKGLNPELFETRTRVAVKRTDKVPEQRVTLTLGR